MVWLFFDMENCHAESIVLLFESRKDYVRWQDHFFEHKKIHTKWHIRYFFRGVLHTPTQDVPKGTYDQKSRYMWGVFNTPLLWRQKGSISKIDFVVMRNSKTSFLIWKMVMQNRLYLYWNRERVMWNGTTIFLIWEMVTRNGRKGFWENVLERYFWGTYFREYFFLSQNESTPDFWRKSGVQNGKSLFEEVYSSSQSRMDALSENKQ